MKHTLKLQKFGYLAAYFIALTFFNGLAQGAVLQSGLSYYPLETECVTQFCKKMSFSQTIPIVIYQTNDIHGYINADSGDPIKNFPATGGVASLATMLERDNRPHIWIDSGDWFQGTPEGIFNGGESIIEIFNALHLDAAELGNHEFDKGIDNLERLIEKARFPVLGANVTGVQGVKPYIVKNIDGVNIGIFGLLTSQMDNLTFPENIQGLFFADEVSTAQLIVKELKAQGADIIIAATHMGIESYGDNKYSSIVHGDIYLANHVDGIDIILGAHTHTAIAPPLMIDKNPHRTMISQAGCALKSVYQIVIYFNASTRSIENIDAHLLTLDPNRYPPNATIQRMVDHYQSLVEQQMSESLGFSAVYLSHDPYTEDLLYNWVSDTFKKYGNTDIGMIDTFGLRAALPAGLLTYRHVYYVMPFESQITFLKLDGKELRKIAEASLPKKTGDAILLRFSGLHIVYDPLASIGQKIISLKVNGADVIDNQIYTITTLDFVSIMELQKKLGVNIKGLVRTEVLGRDVLALEIKNSSPITAEIDGRISKCPGSHEIY